MTVIDRAKERKIKIAWLVLLITSLLFLLFLAYGAKYGCVIASKSVHLIAVGMLMYGIVIIGPSLIVFETCWLLELAEFRHYHL